MAGVTLQTLVNTTRRYLRDWPLFERLGASLSSSASTITVADATTYGNRWVIDVDLESMLITSASSTTLTVLRGIRGSSAASHAASADILMQPNFTSVEIIDAINRGIDAAYPLFYLPVFDTSLFATDSTYEYTIPNMPGTYDNGATMQIPRVMRLEIKQTSDLTYRGLRRWEIRQAADGSRIFKLRTAEPALGNFRVTGIGPFPHLALATDTMDESWPKDSQYLPALYAAADLMMSSEAGRDRGDWNAVDRREEANRPLTSLQTGQQLYNRWFRELNQSAMPPIPLHFDQPI
jgi:hypothetical protein